MRPDDIKTTALLSVEGELDDISGSGQTAAVHDICGGVDRSMQQHYEVPEAGHYGIFSGRRWRELVYPKVKSFILAYQPKAPAAKPVVATLVVVAPPVATPVKGAPVVSVKAVASPSRSSVPPVAKPGAKAVAKTMAKRPATKAAAVPAKVVDKTATKAAAKATGKTKA